MTGAPAFRLQFLNALILRSNLIGKALNQH